MTDGRAVFRVSAVWAAAQAMLGMAGGGLFVVAVGFALDRPWPTRPTLFTLGVFGTVMTGTMVGTVALLSRRLTLTVGPAGLAFAQLVGRPVVAGWSDITAVRFRQVALIPHLMLTVRGRRRPLAVPLRLTDPAGFADAVARHAGPGHPLTEAVYRRLPAG
jgi:hypothetical protein